MRRWLPDIWLSLALFMIPLIFFLPVTVGGRTLLPADNLYQYEPWASAREQVGVSDVPHNGLLSDLVLQNYQWKTFIRQNISDGEIPLWQPNQFGGTPFLANGQHSALYPFSVLYYVLPLEMAYGWFTVIQLWLAGLWMYLYIRGIGLGRIAGMVAAVTVQLSGFFIVATVHPMIQAGAAWLPLILLMIEFTIQRRPFPATQGKLAMLPWVLIGGIALSMSHLAGHIEITYYILLVMALYALLRLLMDWLPNRQQWRSLLTIGLMLIGMVVIGFAIGMVQFLPNVQAANNSFRSSRPGSTLAEVRGFALPARHVAKFLMPNVYGNPAHHEYFDVFEDKMVSVQDAWKKSATPEDERITITLKGLGITVSLPQVTTADVEVPNVTNTDFGIKNYVEGGAYVGILPLVLALYGLYAGFLQRRSKNTTQHVPYRLIFVIMAIVSILFMFGTPFYAILYYGLPGIDQLHTPFRWLFPFTICLAVLAAFGAEALSRSRGEDDYGSEYWKTEAARKPLYVVAKRGGWVLIYGGMAILIGLFVSRLFFDQFEPLVSRVYQGLAKANTAFPDVKSFYSYEFRNVFLLGLIIIGAGAVIRVSRCPIYVGKGERRFPVWQVMAIGLIVVDLFAATYDFNTAAKKEWLDYTPASVKWLLEKMTVEGPFRIQSYEWGEDPLHSNAGWRYGLQDVRGYDSLFSKDYADMMDQIVPQEGLPHNQIIPIIAYKYPRALDNPLLDLLNVRYIITDWIILEDNDPAGMGFKEVYVDGGVRIYENMDVLPRAYTAPLPSEGDSYTLNERCLEDQSIEALDEADLQFIPPLRGACIPIQAADITQYDDTEIRIDAIVDQESWLILADSYDAGWRAFVKPKGASDEEEQEIDVEQVNLDLRGVQLEAGQWTVRFKYSPRSFQLGAFTSFVSGMLVIFLALLWFWRTFVSEQTDEDTGKRLVKNSVAPIALNLFNRGIDFAFAFIMLRILGPSDAGIYYYAIVVFGWFDIFTNFGLNTLLTRDVSRDREAAGRYLFNTSLLRLALAGLGIPALGLVLLIRNSTVEPALDTQAIVAIILLYIGLVPNSISTGLTALFYAFEKAEFPAAMTTVSTLVKVTLGLGALLLGWGVIGLAAVSIITNVVTFVVLTRLAFPLIRANWQPTRDGALQRAMLREAWPLMINHLLATVFFKSDVILMEAINGVRVVGTYSTAYKWLDAINIIPAFFTMALLPIMSRQAHENRDGLRQNYILGIKLLVMIALPTAVMTTFLANALVGFLGGKEFLPDGAIALQLMIWSIPLGWMNSLTQYVLIALDRQRQLTWAFIVAVSFNIITNLIFLPTYSFRAAAITTIFSELVLLVGFFCLIRSPLGTINWVRLLWQPIVASGATLVVMWILWQQMPMMALGIGTLTYLTILWWLQPFSSQEAARLSTILPGRLRRLVLRKVPQT